MNEFFRFPHTPHLAWLGTSEPRDDKVLSLDEANELLSGEVVIEEKLDGANLGISQDADGAIQLQNRGHILEKPFTGQFAKLRDWLALHQDRLFDALDPHLIAFGEWCAARHSLAYDRLPEWWILFDVYDRKENRFWSCARRNEWAERAGVACIPTLFRGPATQTAILSMLEHSTSSYLDGPPEGFLVRREEINWLLSRAKVVRREFTQNMGVHWSRGAIEWNLLASPKL